MHSSNMQIGSLLSRYCPIMYVGRVLNWERMGEIRKLLKLIPLQTSPGLLLKFQEEMQKVEFYSAFGLTCDLLTWRRAREVLDENFSKPWAEDSGWTFTSCENSGLFLPEPNSPAFIFMFLSSKKHGQRATLKHFGCNRGWAQPVALPQTSFFTPQPPDKGRQ